MFTALESPILTVINVPNGPMVLLAYGNKHGWCMMKAR